MSTITTELLKERTGLKIKFSTLDELYALQAVLAELLPPRPAPVAEKPKVKKATKAVAPVAAPKAEASAEEVDLLAPVDASATSGSAPTLGATDSLRGNKYRLQALNPALCVGRKYDEANPVVGTRTSDEGANGIVYPEAQCTKKPIAGSRLCTCCAKNETEHLKDPAKGPKRWYGRLDEPLLETNRIIGSKWFWSKYPEGIEGARPDASVAPVAKVKKAPKAEAEPVAEKAPKVKKASKKASEPEAPAEEAPADEAPATEAPVKAKKPKKEKASKAVAEPEAVAEEADEAEEAEEAPAKPAKPAKVSKATVADTSAARDVEWVTFMHEGVPLIRNTKTNNCYQCDRTKHRLEEMVERDKYEGKWRKGRLDPYAEEDEE